MFFYIINFFILVYFSIIAITLIKACIECLKATNDKSKFHKIEIEIPLPHQVAIGLFIAIKNLCKK